MAQKSNNLFVYPILQKDDGLWNISADVLRQIWQHLEAQDRIKDLFYDGHIKTDQDFIEYLLAPGVFPLLVIDQKKKQIVAVAWLKDVFDGCAWAHHTSIGAYRRGAWEATRDYWRELGVIHLLLGLTPSSNQRAVKFLKKICGFTIVGEVPYVCNMSYEGKRIPGIVSYYELLTPEVRPAAATLVEKEEKPWAAAEKVEVEVAAADQ